MNERRNKILGSIIGGAIGDALGYQIEFKRNIKDKECTEYQHIGMISDDTQMSLFTANALLWRETRYHLKGISPSPVDAIYMAYKDWYDTQFQLNLNENKISWIKDIPELNVQRAPGGTCLSALSSGKKGTIEHPINDSKGCGGIMRVAPIGLYILSCEEAGKIAAEANAITHGHPLGIIPSYILAAMINLILNRHLDIGQALIEAIDLYKERFHIYTDDNFDYFMKLVNKAIDLSKKNLLDIEAISQLGEGWVAEETFAIAIYSCLKYKNSFKDAIVCAVNHDGDSDSTGAIAGNIMGVCLGYDKIPRYYVDHLELKDIILEIAEDLSVDVPVSEYHSDEYWLSKYLFCSRDLSLKK